MLFYWYCKPLSHHFAKRFSELTKSSVSSVYDVCHDSVKVVLLIVVILIVSDDCFSDRHSENPIYRNFLLYGVFVFNSYQVQLSSPLAQKYGSFNVAIVDCRDF